MGLNEIKQTISAEAKQEAEKIEREGKAKAQVVMVEWNKKIEEEKNNLISSAQRKTDQKVQQRHFSLQADVRTEVLSRKQKIIEQVYDKTLGTLKELNDQDYAQLMEKLISQLPDMEAELFSVEGKESLLKKGLNTSKRKFKVAQENVKGQGGFVMKSDKVEIDNRFSALLDIAKEKTIMEVSTILFNDEQA